MPYLFFTLPLPRIGSPLSCYCNCTALPCLPSIVVSSLPNLPGSTSSRSVARFVSRQPPFNLLHWVLALPCLVGISAYLVARSCLFRRLSPGPVDASLIPAALPTSRLFVCKACQTTSSYQTELYFSILYITLPYIALPCNCNDTYNWHRHRQTALASFLIPSPFHKV